MRRCVVSAVIVFCIFLCGMTGCVYPEYELLDPVNLEEVRLSARCFEYQPPAGTRARYLALEDTLYTRLSEKTDKGFRLVFGTITDGQLKVHATREVRVPERELKKGLYLIGGFDVEISRGSPTLLTGWSLGNHGTYVGSTHIVTVRFPEGEIDAVWSGHEASDLMFDLKWVPGGEMFLLGGQRKEKLIDIEGTVLNSWKLGYQFSWAALDSQLVVTESRRLASYALDPDAEGPAGVLGFGTTLWSLRPSYVAALDDLILVPAVARSRRDEWLIMTIGPKIDDRRVLAVDAGEEWFHVAAAGDRLIAFHRDQSDSGLAFETDGAISRFSIEGHALNPATIISSRGGTQLWFRTDDGYCQAQWPQE